MTDASSTPPLEALALRKLGRVLGETRARAILDALLGELGLGRVEELDHLASVAAALQRREGFERTVGAMLAVDVSLARLRDRVGRA